MSMQTYSDREMLVMAVADQLASDLGAALRQKDRVSFCVPGGSSPAPVFDVLSGVSLDWDRVTVFLSDERMVEETSDRSNTALVRRHLLVGKASVANFVSILPQTPQDLPARGEVLRPYMPIDVLLLGMGDDMHTASLFPGAEGLEMALSLEAPILMFMPAPGGLEPRVTLTGPVLSDAMQVHLLITGEGKRLALDRARDLPAVEAPVRCILGQATVHWAP